jgi:UDP-N-acetylglucosamine--N-acetylmuramyl-(pentapeptide) pyrophosphoryl-undecaprenol N-acetylglucosamine transferase
MQKQKTIFFAGGGTGGHFYPIIAIARSLKQKANLQMYFVAPEPYNIDILRKENIKFKKIVSGKFRRYFSFKNLLSLFQIKVGLIQAMFFLRQKKPDLVFIKGGFGALPIGLAALLYKIPIIVHESDVVPGLVNKIFSRWAKKCLISFEETRQELRKTENIILTGNPTRNLQTELSVIQIKRKLDLPTDKPMILVLGGSQGSTEINELIFNLLNDLLVKYSIVHVVGHHDFKVFKNRIKKNFSSEKIKNYHIDKFLDEENMTYAFKACALVISRAGSGSIFNIAQAKKPSILIPLLGAAGDHQRKNAYSYMAKGATIVFENPKKQSHTILNRINQLLDSNKKYENMKKAAESFSKNDASKKISQVLLQEINSK